ncbi:Flavin-dependent oxidoreductase, luciferase family (includes alkanesulfonate monooxygenase SsuD and methylene tetrahydromethanopterin reductase) [Prauserella aidingensis]|uniref:LLM class flavin-dependent oxidoreductase n=1 Tax=Prauserella aidingensis TaxID=387890 RepID=UPI0020A54D0D|nr:LLM class flavin-dependent oxidoreductase [Prauserella aidingensis]MCP2253779.1 Flavin-dependent oxidoreductase, luciferase family (includes alkanesulfonate monooxygenase SsuD and methylene tetrahydromethanopterin reductase) [Prauserella aidingensis]
MDTNRDCTFGLWYDFRNPPQWHRPFSTLYREVLDQIAWAESLGIGSAWLTEHHFVEDGYTPSPFALAAAIGERTSTLRIGTNLIVAPLHNPVRLAEDAATLSLLTGGRFDLGLGQGYWAPEFAAFERELKYRPSLLEESVALIRRAWAGDDTPFNGKRFRLPGVRVTPVPERTPKLLVGALAEPAIERAARIADGFLSTQNPHQESYLDALDRIGGSSADAEIYAGQWTVIAEDPEREWARIGKHALYQLNNYISWGAFGPPDQVPQFADADQIVAAGAFQLWDPTTAVDELTALLRARPQIKDVHFWAQLPGESVESGSARIELLATKVMPEVRRRLAAEAPAGAAAESGAR